MPSTVCSSVVMVFDSSTVITPSLPTFFIASAMMLPMVASLLAEIMPDLRDHVACDGFRQLLDFFDGHFDGFLDAALDGHGICARGDCLDSFAVDGLRQNGGGRGAVGRSRRQVE